MLQPKFQSLPLPPPGPWRWPRNLEDWGRWRLEKRRRQGWLDTDAPIYEVASWVNFPEAYNYLVFQGFGSGGFCSGYHRRLE